MHHIVICGLSVSTVFSNIISQQARFSKKKKIVEHTMCVLIFSKHLSEIPYILESNPHPNPIRTSFCRFLKRKKVSSQF